MVDKNLIWVPEPSKDDAHLDEHSTIADLDRHLCWVLWYNTEDQKMLPLETYAIAILECLYALQGSATLSDIYLYVEERLGRMMLFGDRNTLPAERGPRWKNRVRQCRRLMIEKEYLKPSEVRGTWEMDSLGYLALLDTLINIRVECDDCCLNFGGIDLRSESNGH